MTSIKFIANGQSVLIGSLPVDDPAQALQNWILPSTPTIPIWPQLVSRPLERMLHQFIEGIPGIVEEEKENDLSVYYDPQKEGFEEEQLAFYEDYLMAAEDPNFLPDSRFQVSKMRAQGMYTLSDLQGLFPELTALKGQITGPFTMLTGVHDTDDRLGYYDPIIRDIVVKGLAMKAAWQVQFMQKDSDLPVLIFIDEPALAGLGSSSFISISEDDIRSDINEVVQAIHQVDGLAGVHVCANTEWHILLNSQIDILSFDAYGYFDRLALEKTALGNYLTEGKILAWGIVPTGEHDDIKKETSESLIKLWEEQADVLAPLGFSREALIKQTLITPSCGTGSLPPDLARKVLDLTRDVSKELREKYV